MSQRYQAANFLGDPFLRKTHLSSEIDELYRHLMNSAFSPEESFLVTGAPHASAYYPRDLPVLIPACSILRPSWIPRMPSAGSRLLERSVQLMLEAVCSDVVRPLLSPRDATGILVSTTFRGPRIRRPASSQAWSKA